VHRQSVSVVAAAAALAAPLPALPPLAHHGLVAARWTKVDPQPGNPAVGFGSVWVPSSATGYLDRVDAHSFRVVARVRSTTLSSIPQNQYFDSVAVSPTAVWHASDAGNVVVRIDPKRNRVVARIPVGGRPEEVAAGGGSVYAGLFNTSTVLRISASSNRIVKRRSLGAPVFGVAYGNGAVWAVTSTGPTVLRLDPTTLAVTKRISIASTAAPLGGFSSAWWISANGSTVCAGNLQQNVVSVVDAQTGAVREQPVLAYGRQPFSVAADGNGCLATNTDGVFRTAPAGDSHLPSLGASEFTGVAAGAGAAWVTLAGRNALVQVTG
jgi:hypothetical protein